MTDRPTRRNSPSVSERRCSILGGVAADRAEARSQLQAAVESGSGLDVFAKVIEAQGGDPSVLEDPSLLPSAASAHTVVADRAGFVERCDALAVGRSAVRLGAGRQAKEDDVDPGVGITILAKVGDAVAAGDALATVRYNTDASTERLPAGARAGMGDRR